MTPNKALQTDTTRCHAPCIRGPRHLALPLSL